MSPLLFPVSAWFFFLFFKKTQSTSVICHHYFSFLSERQVSHHTTVKELAARGPSIRVFVSLSVERVLLVGNPINSTLWTDLPHSTLYVNLGLFA